MGQASVFFAVISVAASGCALFLDDGEGGGDLGENDAGSGDGDAGSAVEAGLFDPFGGLDPVDPESLAGFVLLDSSCAIDTDALDACGQSGGELAHVSVAGETIAVLRAEHVEIGSGAVVRVTGSRPLAIVARSITVDGVLDAGSRIDDPGPGAGACGVGGGAAAAGGSGGGGGGFAMSGGGGGESVDGPGGALGAAISGIPSELRAGCPGGGGALGGGGIQLSAADALFVEPGALISAGGAGGEAGSESNRGGRGGGSGGMVVFDSPVIELGLALAGANGGGGGGSGARDASNNSVPGAAASSAFGPDCVFGGMSTEPDSRSGGDGGCLGASGIGAGLAGAGGAGVESGGGGGGGAGWILIRGELLTPLERAGALISPAPTVL